MEEKDKTKDTEAIAEQTVEVPAADADKAADKEEQPAKAERKPHELLYERIRTSRPEAKYDDDEEEYSRQAMSMFDELEKKGKNYDDMSQRLMKRFNANPEEATAFLDYLDGMSLPAAIRKSMGDEALTIKEGDDGWDEYVKIGEERKKDQEAMRAKIDEIRANSVESEKALKEFAKEHGMSDEDAQSLSDYVTEIIPDILAGKITKDMYGRFMRARDYDKDVEGAREQGRIDGKNEKIDIEKKRMAGSGLPNANAGGNADKEVGKPQGGNATADWLNGMLRRQR